MILSGNVIFFIPAPKKAVPSIAVTVSGIETDSSFSVSENAPSPILVTGNPLISEGISTETAVFSQPVITT